MRRAASYLQSTTLRKDVTQTVKTNSALTFSRGDKWVNDGSLQHSDVR